jgi:hypothetical protein
MRQSQQFRAVRRPKDLSSPYALVVVDGSGVPHLPLTLFYHETQRFLCALKQFYHLARRKEWYPYPHPLTDPTANLLQEIEAEERRVAEQRPRMPQRSGVEEPRHRFLSDNYFKLVHETWQPHRWRSALFVAPRESLRLRQFQKTLVQAVRSAPARSQHPRAQTLVRNPGDPLHQ